MQWATKRGVCGGRSGSSIRTVAELLLGVPTPFSQVALQVSSACSRVFLRCFPITVPALKTCDAMGYPLGRDECRSNPVLPDQGFAQDRASKVPVSFDTVFDF